jgi:hypothetical protein
MGRAITSKQLEARADKAKKREAALLAKKLNSTPKPYKKKPPTDIILVSQVGSGGKVFVKVPVQESVLKALPDATKEAFGMKPASTKLADLGTGAAIVDFTGNHKKVLRVTVYKGLTTPIEKNTSWGTRVVKHIDSSYSFPVGGASVDTVIAAFQAAFTGSGALKPELGPASAKGYAVLRLGKSILSKVSA